MSIYPLNPDLEAGTADFLALVDNFQTSHTTTQREEQEMKTNAAALL